MNLNNKRVTILGAKRSGMALAKLILSLGGKPKISEKASLESFPHDFQEWLKSKNIAAEFNGHSQDFIQGSDLLVLSPGVHFDSLPVQWAKSSSIPILGEIEFAFQFCSKPVIAVTGSNGKTTVVTLIKEILTKAGSRVCLCGNVGYPFSNDVLHSQDFDYFVLEVSSFQMEMLLEPTLLLELALSIKGFRPHVAVLLNFSQNHLDRHKSLEDYFSAKKRIFLNQTSEDYAILNFENEWTRNLAPLLQAKAKFFNEPEIIKNFGQYNPNCLAAMAAAQTLGVSQKICEEVFKEFKGVEHRLEWVRTLEGIDFVNDSKATSAEASRWALERIEKPILMICGGRDKNIDFAVLKDLVKQKVKRMYVYGEAKEKLKRSFEGVVAIKECHVLDEAVWQARQEAQEGDCIILSPMCTSFDMFANFEERGRVFKEIVMHLK